MISHVGGEKKSSTVEANRLNFFDESCSKQCLALLSLIRHSQRSLSSVLPTPWEDTLYQSTVASIKATRAQNTFFFPMNTFCHPPDLPMFPAEIYLSRVALVSHKGTIVLTEFWHSNGCQLGLFLHFTGNFHTSECAIFQLSLTYSSQMERDSW